MNTHKISRYFLIIFIFLGTVLQAQDYKKVTISGKDFYQYQVEKSEGFYSIGRKFGVTQEEILQYNPDLKNGLQVGQVILIPVKTNTTNTATTPVPVATSTLPLSIQRATIEHEVEKKETVYSISQLYHVDIDTIYKYNPEAKDKLKKGTILKFPVSSLNKEEIKKETADKKYNLHTVAEKETLYGISKQYNVSLDDLLNLNPELKSRSVKVGEVIRISSKPSSYTEATANEAGKSQPVYTDGKTIKIAFLLPFMLDSEEHVQASDKFFDFYQGALLAIDSLKKTGVSVDVYTYDTDRNLDKIQQILLAPELKTVNLIIGPAYTEQIKPVADYAKANRIKLVIPFSSKTEETLTNDFVCQFNTSQDVLNEEAIDIFTSAFKDKNIIILKFQETLSASIKNFADSLPKKLTEKAIAYKEKNVPNDGILVYSIDKLLIPEKENIVLVESTNPVTLSKIMPALNSSTEKTFSLYGFSEWTQLAKTQEEIFIHDTYITSPFYIDFQDKSVKSFFSTYLSAFGNETSMSIPYYNLLGYDITFYFLHGISKYGDKLDKNFNKINITTLQTGFNFEQVNDNGGYMNKNLFLIKYSNNTKKKVTY